MDTITRILAGVIGVALGYMLFGGFGVPTFLVVAMTPLCLMLIWVCFDGIGGYEDEE